MIPRESTAASGRHYAPTIAKLLEMIPNAEWEGKLFAQPEVTEKAIYFTKK